MSTRPFTKTWLQSVRDFAYSFAEVSDLARARYRAELRTLRVARRRTYAGLAEFVWRLGIGVLAVLLPAVLMSLLHDSLPVTTPGIVLLIAVAGSAYFADWAGGLTSLAVAAFVLNLLFVGVRTDIGFPRQSDEIVGYLVTIVGGVALICLIQRI